MNDNQAEMYLRAIQYHGSMSHDMMSPLYEVLLRLDRLKLSLAKNDVKRCNDGIEIISGRIQEVRRMAKLISESVRETLEEHDKD